MKLNRISFFAITIVSMILASCATEKTATSSLIQKRKYRKGYHVSTPAWLKKNNNEAQDVASTEMAAQVIEVAPTKKLNEVAVTPVSAEAEVSNEQANVVLTPVVGAEKVATETKTAANSTVFTAKQVKKATKLAKKAEKKGFFKNLLPSDGKSQLIALLLVILVGGLGIHRFYLGYTTIGIIQLLTAGGCGIWALIDLIRIVTGDLGPKDGSYDETL